MTRDARIYDDARRGIRAAFVRSVVLVATGCFPPDAGQDPDVGPPIYFPVGLTMSPPQTDPPDGQDHTIPPGTELPNGIAHRWLYLANSDFDLQFNAGTVQVYDLEK